MADEEHAIQRPAQVYQTPAWETPAWETPATNKRRSLFDRFLPSSATHGYTTTSDEPYAKEATTAHHPPPAYSAGATATTTTATTTANTSAATATATATPKTHSSLHARFDALLPPHKTYVGLSRKRFLLFVLLPLAILLLLVFPLALGLGLGLSNRRRADGGREDLPLPANKEVHTGDLTYYAVGLGACGQTHGDADTVVAVSHYVWDAVQAGGNPNTNPLCGNKIRVRRRDGEGSVDVTVVDRCTGCEPTDLDLSPAVFERLADKDRGRVTGTWSWLD
ncbi:Papain inhibitor [Colletotrichum tanaceti]|uniref:Papain inhibitor n=1 Tax=Colletotrichum tanaceti TaxID=1306861 RepID=A0A4U6XCS9_9PEZI|nr:Papain inhibitor [Colletotrichum tanaceti]TKW52989.1 Papain inhibitor [Colletotrichum tanaceti]